MKLVVIIPYLEKMSLGQVEMARSIRELASPDVKGIFCGPEISCDNSFDANYFMHMADPKQGLDGIILKGLFEYDADYIWFFGDDYITPESLGRLHEHLLSCQEKQPLLLSTMSVKNADNLSSLQSEMLTLEPEILGGNSAFLRYGDQLGYISRVIYVPSLIRQHREKLSFFMGTNWVCLAAIFMLLFPQNSSAKITDMHNITVFGIERDQSQKHWYGYETFLYGIFEVINQLINWQFSLNHGSVNSVSRQIIWRALKARIVQKQEGIDHGYASDWDFDRLRLLLRRDHFWFIFLAYHVDFPLRIFASLKRWKRLFL